MPENGNRATADSNSATSLTQREITARNQTRVAMRLNAQNDFLYHPPVGDQAQRYNIVRTSCLQLANVLIQQGEPSCEMTKALEYLSNVMFWANASIARNPLPSQAAEVAALTNLIALEQAKATLDAGSPNSGQRSSGPSDSSPSSPSSTSAASPPPTSPPSASAEKSPPATTSSTETPTATSGGASSAPGGSTAKS